MVDGCTKRYTDPSSLRKHLKTTHDFIEPGQYRKYLDAKKAIIDLAQFESEILINGGIPSSKLRPDPENLVGKL